MEKWRTSCALLATVFLPAGFALMVAPASIEFLNYPARTWALWCIGVGAFSLIIYLLLTFITRNENRALRSQAMHDSHGSAQAGDGGQAILAGGDVYYSASGPGVRDRTLTWKRLMEDFEELQEQGLEAWININTRRDGFEVWGSLASTDSNLEHKFEALSRMAGKKLALSTGGQSRMPERDWYRRVCKTTQVRHPPRGPIKQETLFDLVDGSVDTCRILAEQEE